MGNLQTLTTGKHDMKKKYDSRRVTAWDIVNRRGRVRQPEAQSSGKGKSTSCVLWSGLKFHPLPSARQLQPLSSGWLTWGPARTALLPHGCSRAPQPWDITSGLCAGCSLSLEVPPTCQTEAFSGTLPVSQPGTLLSPLAPCPGLSHSTAVSCLPVSSLY